MLLERSSICRTSWRCINVSTEHAIEEQLLEYFAWLEKQLGPIEVRRAAPPRPRRHRAVALVAAATLVVVGVAAVAWAGSRGSDAPASPVTTPTEPIAQPIERWLRIEAPPIASRWDPVSIGTGDGWFVWGGVSLNPDQPDGVDPQYSGAFYDARTAAWRTVPEMPLVPERGQNWTATWTGSEVVLVQGLDQPKAAAFDPASWTWRLIDIPPEMVATWVRNEAGYSSGVASWVSDRVVIFSGGDPEQGMPGGAMLYDPAGDEWTSTIEAPPSITSLWGPVTNSATELFVIGGSRRNLDSECVDPATLLRFDVAGQQWSQVPLPDPVANPGLVAWTGDRVLVVGGTSCDASWTPRRDAWLFDPLTGTWETTTDLPVDHSYSQGQAVPINGGVAVAGPTGTPIVYWTDQQQWTTTPAFHDDSVDVRLASFDGQLALYGIGTWSPDSDENGATCCTTSDDTFVYRPSPPSNAMVVPAPTSTVRDAELDPTPTSSTAQDRGYVVRLGDSVASIAQQSCVTVDELLTANDGIRDGLLVDQEIGVPPPSISSCKPTASTPSTPSGSAVDFLAIGDTVMLGAAPDLAERGYAVDAIANRQISDAIPLVEELADHDLVGDVVVIHLGNNGPITNDQLGQLLTPLADVPNIVMLNVHGDRPWTAANNTLLRERDRPDDNIILIDWNTLADDCRGDCFAADGLHLAPDGRQFYADLIGDWTGL